MLNWIALGSLSYFGILKLVVFTAEEGPKTEDQSQERDDWEVLNELEVKACPERVSKGTYPSRVEMRCGAGCQHTAAEMRDGAAGLTVGG